jgi:delta1-piperideine-2-carboxylate reductase
MMSEPVPTRLTVLDLTRLVSAVLARAGMSRANAAVAAEAIVAVERDGGRSHGLVRLPLMVEILRSGWVSGRARPVSEDAGPGLIRVDGRNGFAQIAFAAARESLVGKARRQGIAMLAIRNAHHFCALWPEAEWLAERNLVALAFVNSRSYVVPAGGRERLYGTDPMAFACPRRGRPPLAWDQASSVMAHGEVLLARRDGHSLPAGVGVDRDGRPTRDPAAVLDGGALLPFGGYKGSSIALMVEVMGAALTGGRFGFEDDGQPTAPTKNTGELVIAIDPAQSSGSDFAARVEELFARIATDGAARLPGDRRHAARERALRDGIPLAPRVHEQLLALARGG